jgi:amidohydrolase
MKISYAAIDERASGLINEVIRLRRDFHEHPELGFEERRTSSVIARYLADLGLEVKTGLARTGVVGLLAGSGPGKTLMLRADMDALPVQELNEVDYRSSTPGVMHACGHDGHMAILLGAAKLLASLKTSLNGQVMFVFQPAEENLGGARFMIEDGLLENPHVDAALGLHLISILPYGYIGTRKGPFMAAMDTFTIRIHGRGGHSAMPGGSIDAIALSAGVVSGLNDHIRNGLPAGSRFLVNIGTIRGGTAHNIVADLVELEGTVRCLDEAVHPMIKVLMEGFLSGHIKPGGGGFELAYQEGYPTTVNDTAMTDLVCRVAGHVVGPDKVIEMPPSMASEDMSFYLQRVPGCYFFVGAGSDDAALNIPHHNPRFTVDERALETGLRMLCSAAAVFLETT